MSIDERERDHLGSAFLRHEECPECGSSDALSVYSDGHTFCFSCKKYRGGKVSHLAYPPGSGGSGGIGRRSMSVDLLRGEVPADGLPRRRLTQETCERYGYLIGRWPDGRSCQLAQYRDEDGQLIAQKARFRDKGEGMPWTGVPREAVLFGQHLQGSGKMIVITEGELDAMSASQALGNKWPVVSLKDGAGSARRDCVKALSWLEGFEKVVLCFDMDEPGQRAVDEVGRAIGHLVSTHVARLPLKDASDMVVAEREEELVRALFQAAVYRPRGVLTAAGLREVMHQQAPPGLSWPWPSITKATFGRRPGEIIVTGAGVGVGKTEVMAHTQAHDLDEHRMRVAIFSSEQTPAEIVRAIAGKLAGKRFHMPAETAGWTEAELEEAVERVLEGDNLFVYDRAEAFDWESIKDTMRFLVAGEGVRSIYLDNLTAVISHADDERRSLDRLMAELGGMAVEYGLYVNCVSHLTTPEGKPHEEGGRVLEKQFTGSRAIARWASYMVGLERDKQATDPVGRNTTTFRILKDRFTGNATGFTCALRFNPETGSLYEAPAEEDISAEAEQGEF